MPSRRYKPDPKQRTLPFSRRMEVLRKLRTGNTHVKHLLRVLDDHADGGGACYLKVKTISEEMELSERSVKDAIREAIRLGLICVKRKTRERRCNTYILRRAEWRDAAGISLLTDDEAGVESAHLGRPGPDEDFDIEGQDVPLDFETEGQDVPFEIEVEGQEVRSRGAYFAPSGGSRSEARILEADLQTPPPPQTSDLEADWVGVEVELLNLGIHAPDTAVASARNRGCSPAHVRDLVAYRQEHRPDVPLHSLHRRIRIASPRLGIESGWPERQAQQKPQTYADPRQAAQEVAKIKSRAEAEELRERQFGAILDGMPPEERNELAAKACGKRSGPYWQGYLRGDWKRPAAALRKQMLVQLERAVVDAAAN